MNVTPLRLRVRELREAKGLSGAELAKLAKVRPATLSAIELGRTKGIDFRTLERLARALNVDPAFLIATD